MMAKIKDLIHDFPSSNVPKPSEHEAEYLNILANAVNIKATDGETDLSAPVQTFIKTRFFLENQIGYSRMLNKWFRIAMAGSLNDLGNYNKAMFMTMNGHSFQAELDYDPNPDGNYLITGLEIPGITYFGLIARSCKFIANAECAKNQNLEASKFSKIITCRNDDLRLSIEQACQQVKNGEPVIVVSSELGEAMKGEDISSMFHVNEIMEAQDREENKLLTKLGTLSANTQKRERVQSAEVNAGIGMASDYIYMLIDHFNKQCETYGLPFEMEFNGSLEELYEGDDVNEIEKEQEAGAES